MTARRAAAARGKIGATRDRGTSSRYRGDAGDRIGDHVQHHPDLPAPADSTQPAADGADIAPDVRDAQARLVQAIHDADARASLVITGGGISAIEALFRIAGASRTVIEAHVPYARPALDEYLGEVAPRHVSAPEAAMMARVAHARAVSLDADRDPPASRIAGVACTAAIATDRTRRGENRCHVATFDGSHCRTYSLTMDKGARERAGEEAVCAAMVLNALAEVCGVEPRLPLHLTTAEQLLVEDA